MTSHSGRETASILPSASHAPALGRRFGSNMMVRAADAESDRRQLHAQRHENAPARQQ